MTDPAPAPGVDGAPAPAPTRRIVTVRRQRPLRFGIAGVAVGLLAIVGGALLVSAEQAVQVAAAEGRARVGNPVTFDADEREYAITLTPDPLVGQLTEDRIGQLDCAVEHPDGTTEQLDPSSAAVRTSTSVGVFAAAFDGRGGPTAVTCTWRGAGASGGSYSVGRTQEAVQIAGIVALVAGVVLLIAGSWAMVVGYRGRPEVQELSPGAR
jgi:hypothetical protein